MCSVMLKFLYIAILQGMYVTSPKDCVAKKAKLRTVTRTIANRSDRREAWSRTSSTSQLFSESST